MHPLILMCCNFLVVNAAKRTCASYSKITSGKADYYLTGLFPFYKNATPRISGNGLLYMEITRFTIEQANKNSSFRLGYRFYDTCGEAQLNVSAQICADVLLNPPWRFKEGIDCPCDKNNTLSLQHNIGIVGPASSAVSHLTSNLLSADQLPIISYASTSPKLSDRITYPRFLRTIPDDVYQAKIMVALLKKFNWNLVSLVASDNLYGRIGRDTLQKLFKKEKICFEMNTLFDVPYSSKQIHTIVKSLEEKSKSVIIIWALGAPTRDILDTAKERKLYNRTWLFTETLGTSNSLRYRDPKVVSGSFTIRQVSGTYTEFENYFFNLPYPKQPSLAPSIDYTWLETFFNSKKIFQNNSKNIVLRNWKFNRDKIGNVRNSVMAYIEALRGWVRDYGNSTDPTPPINRTLFYEEYLTKVNFTGLNNEMVYFDKQGNIIDATYEIFNLNNNTKDGTVGFRRIASYTGNLFQLLEPETEITWTTNEQPKSHCPTTCMPGYTPVQKSMCCFNCVKCRRDFIKPVQGDGECTKCPPGTFSDENRIECYPLQRKKLPYDAKTNMMVYCLVILSCVLISAVIIIFIYKRNTQIVKASNYRWSIFQLVIQLCLSVSGFVVTFEVTEVTCTINAYTSGLFLSVLLSIVYIKASMLQAIFKFLKRMRRRERIFQIQRQFHTLGIILIIFALLHALLYCLYGVDVEKNRIDRDMKIIYSVCMPKAQTIGSCVYVLCLALICSVQTFQNRTLPSLYNEGKVMMYTVFVLTISIVLVLMMQFMTSVERRMIINYLCVYATNLWLLISMFFGKLHHLWKRRNRQNSRRTLIFMSKPLEDRTVKGK